MKSFKELIESKLQITRQILADEKIDEIKDVLNKISKTMNSMSNKLGEFTQDKTLKDITGFEKILKDIDKLEIAAIKFEFKTSKIIKNIKKR